MKSKLVHTVRYTRLPVWPTRKIGVTSFNDHCFNGRTYEQFVAPLLSLMKPEAKERIIQTFPRRSFTVHWLRHRGELHEIRRVRHHYIRYIDRDSTNLVLVIPSRSDTR